MIIFLNVYRTLKTKLKALYKMIYYKNIKCIMKSVKLVGMRFQLSRLIEFDLAQLTNLFTSEL